MCRRVPCIELAVLIYLIRITVALIGCIIIDVVYFLKCYVLANAKIYCILIQGAEFTVLASIVDYLINLLTI